MAPSRPAGLAAKAHVESLLPVGTAVVVTSEAKPTFERTVGSIEIPGVGDFGALMLEAGHAVRSEGQGRTTAITSAQVA